MMCWVISPMPRVEALKKTPKRLIKKDVANYHTLASDYDIDQLGN